MEIKAKRLSDYLNKELIFVKHTYQGKEELFEEVNQVAFKQGFVRGDFLERVQAREAEFPTGIQLEKIGAAIPHTDSECILKEFIAVVTTDQPVAFKRMEDPSQETKAAVIFVLGLNQPHSQLEMLQTLMSVLQNNELLTELLTSTTAEELIDILTNATIKGEK